MSNTFSLLQVSHTGLTDAQYQTLLQSGLVKGDPLLSWFCDECESEHEFRLMDGQWYQLCPYEPSTFKSPIPKEQAFDFVLDAQKLGEVVREKNGLASLSFSQLPDGIACLGDCSAYSVWLVSGFNPHQVIQHVQAINETMSRSKPVVVIGAVPMGFNVSQQLLITEAQAKYFSLRDMWLADWGIPDEYAPNKTSLVIEQLRQLILLDGKEIALTPAEFKIALIIARSPKPIPKSKVDLEYYDKNGVQVLGSPDDAPDVSGTIHAINDKLNTGEQVFKYNRTKKGYEVVEDYQPVSIK